MSFTRWGNALKKHILVSCPVPYPAFFLRVLYTSQVWTTQSLWCGLFLSWWRNGSKSSSCSLMVNKKAFHLVWKAFLLTSRCMFVRKCPAPVIMEGFTIHPAGHLKKSKLTYYLLLLNTTQTHMHILGFLHLCHKDFMSVHHCRG